MDSSSPTTYQPTLGHFTRRKSSSLNGEECHHGKGCRLPSNIKTSSKSLRFDVPQQVVGPTDLDVGLAEQGNILDALNLFHPTVTCVTTA